MRSRSEDTESKGEIAASARGTLVASNVIDRGVKERRAKQIKTRHRTRTRSHASDFNWLYAQPTLSNQHIRCTNCPSSSRCCENGRNPVHSPCINMRLIVRIQVWRYATGLAFWAVSVSVDEFHILHTNNLMAPAEAYPDSLHRFFSVLLH